MRVAARYRPDPNTAWFATLLRQFLAGVGVLDEAMPAPIAGCMTSQGAATVPIPTASAGRRFGFLVQANPAMPTNKPAKAMPVR